MIYLLNIYFNSELVGNLQYDDDTEKFDLEYTQKWKENGFSISPVLNFQKTYASKDVKNYIENLLPEGEGLESFTKYIHISKNNKFGLLKAMGSETSGALSFIAGDINEIETNFREISHTELNEPFLTSNMNY